MNLVIDSLNYDGDSWRHRAKAGMHKSIWFNCGIIIHTLNRVDYLSLKKS